MIQLAPDCYIVCERLAHRVHLARFLSSPGTPLHTVVTVIEEDRGRVLLLKGLSPGKPLPPEIWRAARDKLFPNARKIVWERRKDATRWHTLDLDPPAPRPTYWQRCADCLRAFYGFPKE